MAAQRAKTVNPELLNVAIARYEAYTTPRETDGRNDGRVWLHNGAVYTGSLSRDGQLDGRGRMEWPDRCVYEGEFQSGTTGPTGKGTMAWPGPGKWHYSGTFRSGVRHGTGEAVSDDLGVAYSGGWDRGQRHGRGTFVSKSGWEYRGEWDHGQRSGKGAMIYPTGAVYGGHWGAAGTKHGWGVMVWRKQRQVYAGGWSCGKAEGKGTHYYGCSDAVLDLAVQSAMAWSKPDSDGAIANHDPLGGLRLRVNRYSGEWSQGTRHGLGTFLYADGSRYTGQWNHNEKEGEGTMELDDGRLIAGTFTADKPPQDRAQAPAPSPLISGLTVCACQTAGCSTAAEAGKQHAAVIHRHGGDLRQLYDEFSASDSSAAVGKKLMSSLQFSRVLRSLGITDGGALHTAVLRAVAALLGRTDRPYSPSGTLLPHEFIAALLCATVTAYSAQHQHSASGTTAASIADITTSFLTSERIAAARASLGSPIDEALNDQQIISALLRAYDEAAVSRRNSLGHLGTDGDKTATIRDVLRLCSVSCGVAAAIGAVRDRSASSSDAPFDIDQELCFFEWAEAIARCAQATSKPGASAVAIRSAIISLLKPKQQ